MSVVAARWRVILCALALCTAAAPARAHDAPRVFGMLERGEHGGVFLTNRGLIFGEPSLGSYRLLCNEALGYTTTEEPNAAVLPDGKLLVATSVGLIKTADEGCTIERIEPFAAANAPALAQAPDDAARIYLATYDAMTGGIYVSTDAGETFTRTYEAPETLFLEELLVAPSDPKVVYASGFEFSLTGAERTSILLVSEDRGETFERIAVPLAENEADLTLLAVAPTDPKVLLAKALDNTVTARLDRLLVSRDGGHTWDAALQVHQLFAAGFTAGAVWVTGIDGLYRSADDGRTFEPVPGPTNMAAVATWRGESLVCGRFALGHNGIASVAPSSTALTPWFEFAEVQEPVACELGTETAYTCETLWRDWQSEILVGLADAGIAGDAGASGSEPDAGATPDAAVMPTAPSTSSSGCSLAAKNANTHAAWTAWALALLALATFRGRRSRRAPARQTAGCRAAPSADTRA